MANPHADCWLQEHLLIIMQFELRVGNATKRQSARREIVNLHAVTDLLLNASYYIYIYQEDIERH